MCDGVHFPAMTRGEVAAVDFARECEAGTLLWTHSDLGRPCG